MDSDDARAWWQKTETLTGLSLAGLVFVAIMPLMVSREAMAFGMSLGYFLAAVVTPLAAVAAIFIVAHAQERLDRRLGRQGA